MGDTAENLKVTPLNALHKELGARMVPFAGYEMPVQYPTGILTEHKHTRAAAGLFDVSHMGQVRITGDDPAKALEALVPGDIQSLDVGKMRYTMFTNDQGGIRDDFMVNKRDRDLFVVFNAACKDDDIAHARANLKGCEIEYLEDRALLALQGPAAVAVLSRLNPVVQAMSFSMGATLALDRFEAFVTRSGYTGEDGFEISVPNAQAEDLARWLLSQPEVKPIGLGARDSLRLEAGLCLYGHDIDATTTPIEAGLNWTIPKRRREEGGFPGAAVIQEQLRNGVSRKLTGIRPEGRAPAREGTEVLNDKGEKIGTITSGGFGPSVDAPIAMGYVATEYAAPGTPLTLMVRGKALPAKTCKLPFITKRYAK
ncbi:MAG TPA: glycine cleavage system aminomethyltransferase GcvT [Ferrovibrio sp.]|uniref:glycine cleavage system aminomethyltransferase GcvT n=1 Tax=Ferrovibrio sp. TaxID=1917215 RepID=UPI002B4ADED8|nr:glycine cleavage system aminomethyltransferase GcvT [Ferrovibrio sp.]HLT78812.1 glycine cleavage system aminomethyltransferase GcvT [Ferrovibrio sp.]